MKEDKTLFERTVDRAMKLYNIRFSDNIKACALYAIDIEIGIKEFARASSMFGITKSEFADRIVKAIHTDGVLPGQIGF